MRIKEEQNDVLSTKPFDKQHKKHKELHPDLLQPPFTLALVGPKGAGKSNVILRLLYGNRRKCTDTNGHHRFYRHWFDTVFVFSPTFALDDKMARCKIPDDQIFDDPDTYEEALAEIISTQEEDKEEDGEADNVLLVFTDLAGSRLFSNNRSTLSRIAFNHRHLNISTIFDTQALRQVNSAFRTNLDGVMLFGGIMNQRLEVKKIIEEVFGAYTDDEARQILEYAFKDSKYDFLFVNMQKRNHDGRGPMMYKKFNPLHITRDSSSS